MTDDQTVRHTITYPEVKEPQKPLSEKHGLSPRKSLLCFNPDGSLCIPADLKDKLVNQPLKAASYKRKIFCKQFFVGILQFALIV